MKHLWIAVVLCTLVLAGCRQQEEPVPMVPASGGEAASLSGSGPASSEAPDETESDPADHGELTYRPSGDVIEIPEKVFIAQINDIYLNAEDYLGKTIHYEGLYQSEYWDPWGDDDGEEIHYVIRYGPGCCGSDGNAGFEVVWQGEYPQPNDWVEVSGVLTKMDFGEVYYLQLVLDSMTVKDERGQEFVLQ